MSKPVIKNNRITLSQQVLNALFFIVRRSSAHWLQIATFRKRRHQPMAQL